MFGPDQDTSASADSDRSRVWAPGPAVLWNKVGTTIIVFSAPLLQVSSGLKRLLLEDPQAGAGAAYHYLSHQSSGDITLMARGAPKEIKLDHYFDAPKQCRHHYHQ